jgi:hypothetical protein
LKSYSRLQRRALRSYLPELIALQVKSGMRPSKKRTQILAKKRNSRSIGRMCARSETNSLKMNLLRSKRLNSVRRKRKRSVKSSIRNRRQ